ncbi:hypothetical protein IMZ48_05165 [Candidatus Bathyarchaeota archaeon]|nr:hypothetical protein [Candidatus Bathyarchaeota archaeon]
MGHAIKAAEFYIGAAGGARAPEERLRLQGKLEEVITLGEYLKAPTIGPPIPSTQAREITPREKVVLLQASKLHENSFLPWRKPHSSPDVFTLKPGQPAYRYGGSSHRHCAHVATHFVPSHLTMCKQRRNSPPPFHGAA